MSKLIIKNGAVFDPINNIEGEIKDILIEKGKIVDKFSNASNIKEINAKDKTVIPSAIEIHTHLASQQVNWARLLGSKFSEFQKYWKGLVLDQIARDYISNGYTFILEANVNPILSKQTIFNFRNLPVLDKAMLLNISNLWSLELEFQRGNIEDASIFLSDLLDKTKAFGFKIYNPFEGENWNFKRLRENLDIKGRLYNFSPLDVYRNSVKFNEYLGLPHSVHIHIEGYEQTQAKDNLKLILNELRALDLKPEPKNNFDIKRNQVFHLAHASSYNIDGDNTSLIKFFNENHNFDLDLGFRGFDPINPLITSERRLINSLNNTDASLRLIRSAVESAGDSFITFRIFNREKLADCIIWANAIDIALNIRNKWQMQLSLNFPNYAHVVNIPLIASWLMSKKSREEFISPMNNEFKKNNSLLQNENEISFHEYVILTRSSPAKSLGLGSIKGNLGLNADGDMNILNINIPEIDSSKNIEDIMNALKNIEYVIKGGDIIKKKDALDMNHNGNILWCAGKTDKRDKQLIMRKKQEFFEKYSSLFYDSYKTLINSNYLREIS